MSRDIRSFFTSTASKKPVEKKEDAENVVIKKRKKHVIIESDSDDDLFVVASKKGKPLGKETKKPATAPAKLEEVEDVSSFFGSKPAKRSNVTTTNAKEPSPKKSKTGSSETNGQTKKPLKTELSVHEDDEFGATLMQLDKKKTPPKPSKKIEPKVETKEKTSPKKDKNKSEETSKPKAPKTESTASKSKSTSPDAKHKSKEKPEKSKSPDRKSKKSPEKEDAALEEIWEKKKQHSENYRKFLQRKGPAHLGEKEIPTGAENCLAGLTFVITGVLDSLDREGAAELIQKYGGKVTGSVSKNTSYMVAGEDSGPSKLEKAKSLNIPMVDEDGLLEMIRTRPTSSADHKSSKQTTPRRGKLAVKVEKEQPPPAKEDSPKKMTPPKIKPGSSHASGSQKTIPGSQSSFVSSPGAGSQSTLPPSPVLSVGTNAMWVDKYKPQTVKHIIGQQTDRSVAKKLIQWLQDWDKNHSNPKDKKPRPSPWAKNDNGAAFKAALLSGPPGIGKTTTVQLVCKELGIDIVEFNASDTRSKKLLHQEVSEMLSTQSLSGMFQGNSKEALSKKRVLLMEEVDGMAGNQDRGGIGELIILIKKAKVPVICTCNDRGSQKIRSLVNYCFDLRVQKPKLEQIRAAMLSICFKEKVQIPKDALDAMIVGTNFDIRQIIHMMSLWAAGQTKVDSAMVEKESKKSKKEFKLGIWEVTPKVFGQEMNSKNAIYDKTHLFFQDYSLVPLFVQENYLHAVHGVSGANNIRKKLNLMSKAADSIAQGDVAESLIRSNQAWGILPVHALYSTVAPGIILRGRLCNQAQFPSWLGKYSKTNKFDRLASELQMHMRLSITGSKKAVVLDYINPIRDLVMSPLTKKGPEGVSDAIDAMVNYNLIREDLDKLDELSTWGSNTSPWQRVDGKIKAQLTRQYNKMPIMTPFAIQSVSGGAKRGAAASSAEADYLDGDEDEAFVESEEEEDNDAGKDSMIKAKKVTAPKAAKGESARAKGAAKPAASKRAKK